MLVRVKKITTHTIGVILTIIFAVVMLSVGLGTVLYLTAIIKNMGAWNG